MPSGPHGTIYTDWMPNGYLRRLEPPHGLGHNGDMMTTNTDYEAIRKAVEASLTAALDADSHWDGLIDAIVTAVAEHRQEVTP